jgi:hypothetical protein
MTIARRARRPLPAKPLPTERVAAQDQVAVIRTVGELGRTGTQFTASDLNDYAGPKLGIATWKPGLMIGFMAAFGLTEPVPSKQRGLYKATPKLIKITDAWDESPERGITKLREALGEAWFVRTTRERLADGPGQREGLHLKLRQSARVDGSYRAEIDRLIDLMIEVRMLIEEPDGALRWYRTPAPDAVPEDTSAATNDSQSEDDLQDDATSEPADEYEPEREPTQSEDAPQPPTDPEFEDAFTGEISTLLTLQLGPWGLGALPQEIVIRLHRDIRQLLITVQELTNQFPDVAKQNDDPSALPLAQLGALALDDVLKAHQAAHDLRHVFPSMRRPRTEQPV